MVAAIPAAAQSPDDIRNSFPGRFFLEVRPRYNAIEESNKPLEAEGFTQRTTAGWEGAPLPGLKLTLELIHAGPFAKREFNTLGANRTSPYPLLPDPHHTGVNRAHVEFTGWEATRVRLGRQLVRLGNQRWVSDNDFRQVPQLFDGIAATYVGIGNVKLEAGHFRRVRETSGARRELELTTLEAAWNPAPGHALCAYAVFHDQRDNQAFSGLAEESYRVIGARAEGTAVTWRGMDLVYTAEYARQDAFAGGDPRIDVDYWRWGTGLSTRSWTVRYDRERRGSNGGVYGLQAPLTDHYAWNGWTLHFFNGPREGLVDRWVTARVAAGPVTLYAEAHRFRTDFGNAALGREVDLGVTWELRPEVVARLQHGRYDPGAGTPDPTVRKTWLTVALTW